MEASENSAPIEGREKCLPVLEKILNSKVFMSLQIVFVLLSSCEMMVDVPSENPALK